MKIKLTLAALALTASAAFAQSLSSGIDRANMDLSKKPGTDFYEYAGGGWMKAHPLTDEYSRYGQFNALEEENRKQLLALIEEMAAKKDAPKGSLEQKVGAIYRLAMDSLRRNREGYTPIKPQLQQIAEAQDKRTLLHLTQRLGRIGISDMIGASCGADLRNAKMNLVSVSQAGISMGNRDYYLENDEASVKMREAYKAYVKKLFMMTGSDEPTAQRNMETVLSIETALAKEHYSNVKLRDTEANYHKMSYAQLLRDYPGFDWNAFFFLQGFPYFEEINVGQPEAIRAAIQQLNDRSLDELKAYYTFQLINGAAAQLSDEFRETSFDFYGRTMSGAQQDRPRWKRAVSAVEGVLGMALGKLYVEKYFPESSKKRMLELVNNLKTALDQRIDLQSWMSTETKKQAKEKLATFYVKIGYPDTWRSYEGLNIDEELSYYENMCRATTFDIDYYITKNVNKPVDIHEWHMTPQTINAYYNPTTNEICFPAGILQPPFFNPAADDAANYGAIGVVIGHEMTHGFDDQGAQFDKEGNLRNWWTEADKKQFKLRTDKMVHFFDKIEVLPGLKANGALTCGENIADHGGLKLAYQALQNATKSAPLPVKDGFSPEQRFFLSYALLWAGNVRPEYLRMLTKNDPHSAGRWRVNGALPHIDAWYKAFNIKKGDKLYLPKSKRVDVW
ncbi:MAG: M13 family metallopeptidase [Bacteroidales bacterium]|nr:M13 family metallopeptidase [Bacteroidales bacterium]